MIFKNKERSDENKKLNILDKISDKNSCHEKWFSVVKFNFSKGNVLKILAHYLGISIENIIAIGNYKNDISMFLKSGFSVVVFLEKLL